jgi:hypothetical protein
MLSLPLFNVSVEYAIMKVKENQVRLKLNETQKPKAYAADMNLLGENEITMMYKTETLIDAGTEGCLEINAERTACFSLITKT